MFHDKHLISAPKVAYSTATNCSHPLGNLPLDELCYVKSAEQRKFSLKFHKELKKNYDVVSCETFLQSFIDSLRPGAEKWTDGKTVSEISHEPLAEFLQKLINKLQLINF